MPEIDAETSKYLAKEMNDNYPVLLYAMAKQAGDIPPGFKISSCQAKSVSKTQCEISYTTCRGDVCNMPKKVTYKFPKPLGDKVFFLRLQSRVAAPSVLWLFTKPLALLILVTCTLLSIGTMGMGVDGMTEAIEKMPRLEAGISTIFGSGANFASSVMYSWVIAVVAHFSEAVIAYSHCTHSLRFRNEECSLWGLLIFMVGWPIFQELMELVEVKTRHSKAK